MDIINDTLRKHAGDANLPVVERRIGTLLLGLVVVLPVLGHASWHAYRDLVDASVLPERLPPPGAV